MKQLQSEIVQWLGNPADYSAGLSLLTQVCKNRHLVKAIARSENKYNVEKMKGELRKSLGSFEVSPPLPASVVHDEPGAGNKTNPIDPLLPLDQHPAGIPPDSSSTTDLRTPEEHKSDAEKLELSFSRMHNKKGILSNSLRNIAADDNAGRLKVIAQIDDIKNSMDKIQAALAIYRKTGQLPPKPDSTPTFNIVERPIPEDPIKLAQMLTNERSNRSKIKSRLENLRKKDEKKRPELEARYASKVQLIVEIERRLTNGGN